MGAGSRAVVVQMYPDYAGTVLWCSLDVDYAESGLEEDLVADLRAWEAAYYAGLDDFSWRSPELERRHRAEGHALARRVAGALGEDFVVECGGRTFRGKGPARTPAAAAAFGALAAG